MKWGIEAMEIYFPKTFVDQADLGMSYQIQKSIMECLRENTPKGWVSSNLPSPILSKMSTLYPSQVYLSPFSCQQAS